MSDDMQEKFVADDGVSTVPEPVTPAGGEAKKKMADVKKKVDPSAAKVEPKAVPGQKMAEESEDDDVEVIEEEIISIDESIASIFEGMDLSEDFKSKVTMVFEAAVNEAATVKANAIAEELEEQFETQLEESIDSVMEEIVENLDAYLDYVVSEWMEENALAVESGIKVGMAESLMDGLRELFSEHNIHIDEDTVDVVAGLEEHVEELTTTVNEAINENIELAKEIASLKAEKIFEEMTEDLTVSQAERLRTLSEKLDFSDLESYTSNLGTLKESFFKKSKATLSEDASEEDDEIITEDTTEKKVVSQHPTVNALVEALNKRTAK
jgi:murein L,D-transpeptidase YcbB/YkuD